MINIIANVKSGKGKGARFLKRVVAYLTKRGVDYTLFYTQKQGHATSIASAVTKDGGTVIAVGGDGTFHEVLNGISNLENTKVGFIPAGRGNDFARAAGFPLNPVKALKNILDNPVSHIDFIQVGEKRCLNIAGTGLDIEVLRLTEHSKGQLSYVKSLIYMINHFTPYPVEIETDRGDKKACDCIMVGVCNGHAFGGNIKIAPPAKIDDGLLDVIIMEMPDTPNLMPLLLKFIKGKHMDMPITNHYRCKSIKVTTPMPVNLDGEIYENLPFNCEIVSGKLATFLPLKK